MRMVRCAHRVLTRAAEEMGHTQLEVQDGSQSSPALVAVAPLDTTGRGIAIVDALSQTWGVDDEGYGKSVWAVFSTA